MKNKFRAIPAVVSLLLVCLLLVACGKTAETEPSSAPASSGTGALVLKLENNEFTDSEILAMMDLTARSYTLNLEEVQEDVKIWNSLVDGTVYNYAAAEIARNLCTEYGLLDMTEDEKAEADAFYETTINSIKGIGEDPDEYLTKMGLSEEQLRTYSEDQIYKTHLSKYWFSQMPEASGDSGMAEFQELMNFTSKIWDVIHEKEADGSYFINESGLLLEEPEE